MNSAQKAVDIARSLMRVKWIHQGRNVNVGIDCCGLLVLAFEPEEDFIEYSAHPHNGQLEGKLFDYFGDPVVTDRKVIADDLKLGDVVAMSFGEKGVCRHVGIIGDYLYGGPSIIHTDSSVGFVTEHAIDDAWLAKIKKVYRV
ncbi:putative cell wall peptidase [Xanthomonas phage XAJ2]|uniref:Putative cell wall peptidase n=1 Tax=Xanthomonas phage XAJ2 TaxID=1775249 RepID=A0A1I9L2F2_9CAUD|nr:putative cell wall peptidase [Xanthomonas phage XAJ2]